MKTVLIVDDKLNTLHLLTDYLTEHGFRIVTARNGREALYVARYEKPDLVLLDLMMPEMDGLEFMRHFRKERQTPVIMLTARVEETDKVIGLELGADDYVTKPFGMAELVARIRAVMRRAGEPGPVADTLRVNDVMLDRSTHLVRVSDRRVDLTPSEFDLLTVLMSAPGQVFTRAQLLERLKGDWLDNVERTIDVHIRNLRTKLEPDPAQPHYILTVFGVGYRFCEEVAEHT
ncbi:MAG TPA: response regulator transcription factor [Aggregatilineales bacterium]|nr:response regulator transcription factor [Aggregatilineales bacterium]